MARDPRSRIERSLRSIKISGAGPAGSAMMASYTLIGAIILLGGIGYAIDAWRGSSPWGLLIGLMLGLVVGFYELAKAVWRR
jgi:F0F1-type ATP synthase assembly protein I